MRSKKPLNHLKKRFGSAWVGLSNMIHSAGVSVSATTPEIVTDTAIVIANCLYISPAMPPKNATGTNTAHNTKTIATTGPLTSCIANWVDSMTDFLVVCMMRSTFSSTTIASSTTIPIANTIPNKVKVLIEKPSTYIPANVPIIDTGTAKQGIKVARQFCKNKYTTANTKIIASINVVTTSSID